MLNFYLLGDEASARMRLSSEALDGDNKFAMQLRATAVRTQDRKGDKQCLNVVQVELQVSILVSLQVGDKEKYFLFYGEVVVGLFAVSALPDQFA